MQPSLRRELRIGAIAAIALLLGFGLGWLTTTGPLATGVFLGVLGLLAALAVPLGAVTQAFVFVSQAFPKAGRLIHGFPLDIGVLLSLLMLAKWGLTALVAPDYARARPNKAFTYLLFTWLGWLLLQLMIGVFRSSSLSLMAVEGAALGVAPLSGYWIASLPAGLTRRVLAISRGALVFVVCFAIVQALLHGHHTAINGITVEAGGASGYAAIYDRNNATNVGLKAVATYQNGNLLGAYFALAAPLVMLIRERRWRIVGFGAVLAATLLTLSRGAWFSVAFSFAVLGLISKRDRWSLYAIMGVLPILALSSTIARRFGHSFATLSGRVGQYAALWTGLTHHLTLSKFLGWFVGWGLGGGPSMPGGGRLTNLDSSMAWLYLCTGLIGLVLYGAMIWTGVRPGLSNRLGRTLFAGICGALLFQIFDGQLFYVPIAWNFWIFVGLAMASSRYASTAPPIG